MVNKVFEEKLAEMKNSRFHNCKEDGIFTIWVNAAKYDKRPCNRCGEMFEEWNDLDFDTKLGYLIRSINYKLKKWLANKILKIEYPK